MSDKKKGPKEVLIEGLFLRNPPIALSKKKSEQQKAEPKDKNSNKKK